MRMYLVGIMIALLLVVSACTDTSYITTLDNETSITGDLHVDGDIQVGTPNDDTFNYVQIDANQSAPPSSDCDEDSEAGRMFLEDTPGADLLYVCAGATDGWVSTIVN